MDMTATYEQEIRLHCPQAAIVYDLFHVVAKYGREVIDRVRVDEANRLRRSGSGELERAPLRAPLGRHRQLPADL